MEKNIIFFDVTINNVTLLVVYSKKLMYIYIRIDTHFADVHKTMNVSKVSVNP